jgi:hypothetical protein
MSKFRSVFVGVALLAGSLAGMASAAVMQATYMGTVFDSSDPTNLFGAGGGSSLDGLAFKAVFIYDPATPGASRKTTSTSDYVLGGTLLGVPSPMRSARLTINEHTASVDAGYFGAIGSASSRDFSSVSHNSFNDVFTPSRGILSNVISAFAASDSPLFPLDLDSSVPLTSLGSDPSGGGAFRIPLLFPGCPGCVVESVTEGRLSPSSVQIAPIPIPAALPLLASGLAGLGFVAFRRGRRGQAAA